MVTFLRAFKKFIVILFFLSILKIQAQLGFCTGNSGDPIVEETFGHGSIYGSLPKGSSSNYKYIYGEPNNGFYTIATSSFGWFGWHNIPDHTANDTNGRMLIVNAGKIPGEFFRIAVSGLCENTSYEFSSWLINLLPSNYRNCGYGNNLRPINVSFEIWDSTDTVKLKSGNTGNLYGYVKPKWEQYALLFQTRPGQTSVILKIRNNGVGGCGNDLALDDIVFKPCGDKVIITDTSKNQNISVSKNELPFSTTLKATPDFSVFSTHAYQWQESKDGTNWVDITGETEQNYMVKISSVNASKFYRVRVAETANNLLNALCYSNSEFFEVKIVEEPKPTIMIGKQKLAKTYKKVIIVKDGHKIIHKKVWVDGAIGKFVQTSEDIIQQGGPNSTTIIDETIYYKSIYGYNSKRRRYIIK